MRKKHYLWGIIIALVLVLFITACSPSDTPVDGASQAGSNVVQAAAPAPTSTPIPTAAIAAPPTYVVQRGNVENIFTFTGRWQPRDQMMLSFPTSGTISQVKVRRGDAVKKGDLLADYDVSDLQNQLANAKLQLETAQSNVSTTSQGGVQSVQDAEIALANARLSLENTKAGSPWTSVATAKLQVESAQQSLEDAQRSYNDALSHPENPASTVDSAYQQLVSAQNQLKSAQYNYFSAAQNFNNHDFAVKQAENQVTQAEIALERAKSSASAGVSDENVRSAQLTIDQVNQKIAASSLYAPIDGVILDVSIAAGDAIQAYKTVMTIGLPEPKEVVASLAITDANQLSVGMVGVCQVMNHPETAVGCVVRSIPLNSQDADQTSRIAASLSNVTEDQLIQVQMPLAVRENVLWLPPSVIRTFQNRTFVVLQTPDGPRTVDVVLGLQTTDRDEIVSGVNEGDVVIAP